MSTTGYHWKTNLGNAENEPPAEAKARQCLKCRAPFVSAWVGERVCRKCKTSRVWRDGVAANLASWSQ